MYNLLIIRLFNEAIRNFFYGYN